MKIKIAHLTSVHFRYDTRIFIKMCRSLAKNDNYDVSLVVADGIGDEIKHGVTIIDIGAKTGKRISRMTKTVSKMFARAKKLNADIYHLHDPELIPIGLKLKKSGKKVILDSHEDFPKQIFSKPYLNRISKIILSKALAMYENISCRKFDFIIAATPHIRDKFLTINPHSIDINNFPKIDEFADETSWETKKDEVCYIGGLSTIRGIKEMIKAMEMTANVKLNLGGSFSEKEVEAEVKRHAGWHKINELGFLDRDGVADVLRRSKAGLVIFHLLPNNEDAQPTKMFEYMAAGIPVIASNFPVWRKIVESNNCGLCVDPENPQEIASAIEYIIAHGKEAEEMGHNGKKAVIEKYNWTIEERKLLKVYETLPGRSS